MKKTGLLLLLVGMIVLLATPVFALEQPSAQRAFTLGARNSRTMDIQFSVPDYKIETKVANGTVYNKVNLGDTGYTMETGLPELPYLNTTVAIPYHGNVSVEIISAHEKVVRQFVAYPSQGDIEKPVTTEFHINRAFYESGQTWPQETIRFSDPYVLRDFRIINLQVQPFAYNSATNELIVRDQVEFRLHFDDSPGVNEIAAPVTISPAFAKIYEANILNFRDYRDQVQTNTPPRYLIIYGNYNDATFMDRINNYVFWKKQKGANIRLVSTAVTGSSTTAIKAYIQTLYNDPESRPDYIVLIGDVTGSFAIPTWTTGYGGSSGAGDYPYTHLAGNDGIGDVFIGRISAESTSQLEVILAKIYYYEKTLNMATAAWLNRMLIVGDSYHDGQSVINLAYYIKEISLDYNPDYTYSVYAYSSPSPSLFDAAMNNGVGFFHYRGYIGMSGWSPTSSLVNGTKLPHAVINTCSTGNFDSTGTTESFIRLGTAAVPAGAVTATGMYSSGTHTLFNNILSGGMWAGIFTSGMRTMGESLLNGKAYMTAIMGVSQPSYCNNFSQWCNLMGDPTMEVYCKIPGTFSINAPASLPIGSSNLDLNIINQDAQPVNGACVTISQGNVILARTYSDATGFAYLPFNTPLAAGNAVITVSMHEYKPLQYTITVDEAGSLVAGNNIYDDDMVGFSHGNGDLNPNSGERMEVIFSVRNTSPDPVEGVTGFVTSASPYLTIINPLVNFGTIQPGQTQNSFSSVVLDIAPNCPNYMFLRLIMNLTSSNNVNYTVPDHIISTDAFMRYTSQTIVNGGTNNVLDAGETAQLNITVSNYGTQPTTDIYGRLYSDNDLVAVDDNIGFFGNIGQFATVVTSTDNFTVHARSQTLTGMQIPMRLKLYNTHGYLQWLTFKLPIGIVTQTSPLGPDAYGYVIYDDGDLSYPECPVYQWTGIAPAEGGSGTALTISDPDASGEGDDVSATSLAAITLPFPFMFYGISYTNATACSNGFLVMGTTQNGEFRNYRLPGAMGPSPMIAAFWDDLCTVTGSGIYKWFDSATHRFIVEWYQFKNGYSTSYTEQFQIILYDPAFYPTSTGDGAIKIQYHTFNNVDSGTGTSNHGNYSTIGIENHDQRVGLEYTFNNTYPTAARPLQNNRCIFIAPAPIYHALPELTVQTTPFIDTNNNNIIEPGEMVQLNVQLQNIGENYADNISATLSSTDPFVSIQNTTSAYDLIEVNASGMNLNPFAFTVSPQCPGNHTINFNLTVTAGPYSVILSFGLLVQKPELNMVNYYLNDLDGNNNGLPNANEDFLLIVNLTNDSPVDAFNLSGVLATDAVNVTIANPTLVKPWLHQGDKLQFVYQVHFSNITNGTIVPFDFTVVANNASQSMFDIDLTCGGGTPITTGKIDGHMTLSNGGAPLAAVVRTNNMFLTNPAANGAFAFYFPVGQYGVTATCQYCHTPDAQFVSIASGSMVQPVNFSLTYLSEPTGLTLSGIPDETQVTITWTAPVVQGFTPSYYKIFRRFEDGVYQFQGQTTEMVYGQALSDVGTYYYYVSAVFGEEEGAPSQEAQIAFPFVANPEENPVPDVTALHHNYPNPFNPTTTLSYALAKGGRVTLRIYNTRGQLIRTLLDTNQKSGQHRIVWNGLDNQNKPVGSGVYFYRLQTNGYDKTQKMMLLK